MSRRARLGGGGLAAAKPSGVIRVNRTTQSSAAGRRRCMDASLGHE